MNKAESVARAIFSPRMVYNGELQPEAFQLRASLREEYLSVLRMAISSWENDMMQIPQRRNRQLYGYAKMEVAEILSASFQNVDFDVRACDNEHLKSHAGIFITVSGENLIGGKPLKSVQNDCSQDFLLLMIQRRLVEIARKGLRQI